MFFAKARSFKKLSDEVILAKAPKVLNAEVLSGKSCTKFLTNLVFEKLYRGSKFL